VTGDTNGSWDVFVRDRQTNTTTILSVAPNGTPGNSHSHHPRISADGRYVAFDSDANNLVTGDTNGHRDIFIRDRQTNTTTLVSVATDGTQGNGNSQDQGISADGRYVAFASYASNLVTGDTNGFQDIFVRDRQTSTTTRVSVASDGTQANWESYYPCINADGRFVGFASLSSNLVSGDTNSSEDIFVRDLQAGTTTLVSLASDGTQENNDSDEPCLSANGRYVAFESEATNLVPGDTNGYYDIFVATLIPPTAIASINPKQGIQGETHSFIINGAGFTGATAINFGDGVTVKSFSVNNDSKITANLNIADGASAGVRIVTVTTPGGTGRLNNGFWVDLNPVTATPRGASVPTTPGGPVGLPAISVQSASLSAGKVPPGTPVTVTANVANTGTVNGTTRIAVYVNGQEDSSQGITVNSGSNTPVTFSVSRNEPGTYTVYVGGTSAGSFTVDVFAGPGIIICGAGLLFLAIFATVIVIFRRNSKLSR
jgi:Tol biopolymer transport system component